MKTFIPDQMLLYMTEAAPGDWYHIPHQMVTGYLSRGHAVRERRKGVGWVELSNVKRDTVQVEP